jgi:hypothetical protein
MFTTSDTAIRELDHRTNDDIDVTLFWNSQTNHVSVAVEDRRTEESFELQIRATDALDAFHHPYGYRRPDRDEHALAA